MSLEMDITGIDQIVKSGDTWTNDMVDRYGTYLEDLADDIIDEARSNLQNNTNISTGTLLASIQILENNQGKEIVVGTDEFYAPFIEYGRGEVKPINAKALHWIDKTTGEDVFAKYAKATEPMPFFEPAWILKIQNYPQTFVDYESKYLENLGLI